MENNKVVLSDGTTLIDITDTTAAPETVALGEVFYDAAGVRRVGSANYMALVSNPTAGDVLITDANGQAQDSGTLLTDLATKTYVDSKFAVINWSTTTYAEIRAIAEARTPFWVIDPTLSITDPTLKAFHATQVVVQSTSVTFKILVADKHYGYTIDSSGQKSRFVGETYALAGSVSSKMDLVSTPTAGDLLTTNASGQAVDSGVTVSDLQDVFVATYGVTTFSDLKDAIEAKKVIKLVVSSETFEVTEYTTTNSEATLRLVMEPYIRIITVTQYGWSQTSVTIATMDSTSAATDTDYGVVKTNAAKSITLNADGQLEVGGRLGQFPDGGVYYPDTIEPTEVKASTFLMSDGAKYLSLGPRTFGIMAGVNLTCRSAAAGATQYRLSNNQTNRFACFACRGGRLAIDQIDATENGTALMTDISFANGNPISAYFGPTESSNDIIITVDRTVNPSAATTKLRMYGTSTSSDVIIVGQGNGASGGKAISLGQACFAGGNQCIAFGNSSISTGNNSVAFGHTHLVDKQFCFAAGQGHDFANAGNGTGAVGIASELSSDTAFAVGNGTFNANGNITRSNALEVKKDGGIVLKSPNGTRYKVTVTDAGALTVSAV